LTPKISSYFYVVGDSLKNQHMEGEDPYESFALQHGEVAGRTRGIRSGRTARRKREAYIRHRVAAGEIREEVAGAHSGGQSRPLGISRNWEPNPESSSEDPVEIIECPQPRRVLSELGTITLVPQSALYHTVRAVILMETYAVAIPAIGTYIAVMYIHVCRCSSCPVVQTVELKTTPIPFYFHSMYSSDNRGVCQSRKTIMVAEPDDPGGIATW
jgi:hypothetical protein